MKYAKAAEKFSDEAFKLTREERMRLEFAHKGADMDRQVRREVEAVVSAGQLLTLKEIAFRRDTASALSNASVQKSIGITEEQKTALARIAQQSREAVRSLYRATYGESLAWIRAAGDATAKLCYSLYVGICSEK